VIKSWLARRVALPAGVDLPARIGNTSVTRVSPQAPHAADLVDCTVHLHGRLAEDGSSLATTTSRNSRLCTTNTAPSSRKAEVLSTVPGAMNCGRKARKNKATFGFSTLVSSPMRKSCQALRGGGEVDARPRPAAPGGCAPCPRPATAGRPRRPLDGREGRRRHRQQRRQPEGRGQRMHHAAGVDAQRRGHAGAGAACSVRDTVSSRSTPGVALSTRWRREQAQRSSCQARAGRACSISTSPAPAPWPRRRRCTARPRRASGRASSARPAA
jgi:hypothetical protein